MFRLYNTLGRHEVDLAAATGKRIGDPIKLYTCGPTVYHFAHIGNLRTYVWEDVLERMLEFEGYPVDRVMNLTDVGHLTSDADEGEDKMDKAAAREGKSIEDIIRFYTEAFLADCAKLRIRIPKKLPRASAYVEAQQELVAKLLEKGLAYDTPEAVYFDTSLFPQYGALSGQKLDQKSVAAREEVVVGTQKRNPADFALWFKLTGRFERHLQHWPSPWGEGFPGWHLECSALIHALLGEPVDIHTGGVDHIGTHHTNEIAQSEGAYGSPFTHVWMHGEHLLVNEDKMAKSAGNSYTLSTLLEKGYDPLAFRYLCLGAHYRTKMNFTWESLEAAARALDGLRSSYAALRSDLSATKEDPETQSAQLKALREALEDDLNTPQALAVVHTTLKNENLSAHDKIQLLDAYDQILQVGLALPAARQPVAEMPKEVRELMAKREEARRNKQFMQADDLRKQAEALGYTIEDTPQGPIAWPNQRKDQS